MQFGGGAGAPPSLPAAATCLQAPGITRPSADGRILIPPPSPRSIPSPYDGEVGRVRERGFQKSATIRWNEPLSPALSPLVPRRERGHFSNGGCIKMGPWADEMTDTSLTGTGRW